MVDGLFFDEMFVMWLWMLRSFTIRVLMGISQNYLIDLIIGNLHIGHQVFLEIIQKYQVMFSLFCSLILIFGFGGILKSSVWFIWSFAFIWEVEHPHYFTVVVITTAMVSLPVLAHRAVLIDLVIFPLWWILDIVVVVRVVVVINFLLITVHFWYHFERANCDGAYGHKLGLQRTQFLPGIFR